jgi:hypothetical protein
MKCSCEKMQGVDKVAEFLLVFLLCVASSVVFTLTKNWNNRFYEFHFRK